MWQCRAGRTLRPAGGKHRVVGGRRRYGGDLAAQRGQNSDAGGEEKFGSSGQAAAACIRARRQSSEAAWGGVDEWLSKTCTAPMLGSLFSMRCHTGIRAHPSITLQYGLPRRARRPVVHAQELHLALVAVALDMWSDRSAAGKTGQGQRIARGGPKCRRLLFCCPAFNNRDQFAVAASIALCDVDGLGDDVQPTA